MYLNGDSVKQDLTETVRWFRKATDQGPAQAQLSLGLVYANGQCVEQGLTETVR